MPATHRRVRKQLTAYRHCWLEQLRLGKHPGVRVGVLAKQPTQARLTRAAATAPYTPSPKWTCSLPLRLQALLRLAKFETVARQSSRKGATVFPSCTSLSCMRPQVHSPPTLVMWRALVQSRLVHSLAAAEAAPVDRLVALMHSLAEGLLRKLSARSSDLLPIPGTGPGRITRSVRQPYGCS